MTLAQTSSNDAAIVVVAASVLFIRLLSAAWKASHIPWRKAVGKLRELPASLSRLWRRSPNNDNSLVTAKMTEWELQHFRHAITMVSATCSFFCAIHLVNISTGATRVNSAGQDLVFYTVSVTAVLLDMCPSVITDRTINWVCGFYTCIALVAYLPGICPPQNITWQIMYANLLSFGLSMSRLQVEVVVICNVLHTAFWAVRLLTVDAPLCVAFTVKALILLQCAWIMILVVITWILRQSLLSSFQKDVEAKTLRGEQSAFKELLRMVCDVVIELDPQLCLVGPTQALCTFLLRGSTQSMEGIPLVELMPREEDRARFHTLCNRRDGPSVMHFSLRDGNGTLIEVELFSFLFEGLDGKSRCFAGLREFSDTPQPAAQPLQPNEDIERMRFASAMSECILTESPQAIKLDTGDPHLRIQSISQGLEQLTGATEGGTFLRYLGNSREFTCWLQSQVNITICTASNVQCIAPTCLEVRLRPRFDWNHSHISAVCKLLDDGGNSSIEGSDCIEDADCIEDSDGTEESDGTHWNMHAHVEIQIIHYRPRGFRDRSVPSSNSNSSVRGTSCHSAPSSNIGVAQTCSSNRLKMQAKAVFNPVQRESPSGIITL